MAKVIFAGVARDCESYLPAVLRNIENMSKIFSDSAYMFVENDSKDNTKKILSDWGRDKAGFYLINLDGLKSIPVKTVRLEMARNAYLQTFKYYPELRDYDYVVIIDMDQSGEYVIDLLEISKALNFLAASPIAAAVFANQTGKYYDMWAYRSVPICPGDIWEDVLDYKLSNNCSDQVAFDEMFAKRVFVIEPQSDPIKVDSAFGGFGIYKMRYVLNNPNPYLGYKTKLISQGDGKLLYARWQTCEHVHFHTGIKSQGGEMYILPSLINGDSSDLRFSVAVAGNLLF